MKKNIIGLVLILGLGNSLRADEAAQVIPEKDRPEKMKVFKDIVATVKSSIDAVGFFKQLPDQAKVLLAKTDCISGGDNACIANFVVALADFLNGININLFGTIKGTSLINQGPLVNLATLMQTGYAYRGKKSKSIDGLVINMTGMASRIQSSVEFLQLFGFMLNPMGNSSVDKDKKAALQAEPIVVKTEELGGLDL